MMATEVKDMRRRQRVRRIQKKTYSPLRGPSLSSTLCWTLPRRHNLALKLKQLWGGANPGG
jgi:hypothetical protein